MLKVKALSFSFSDFPFILAIHNVNTTIFEVLVYFKQCNMAIVKPFKGLRPKADLAKDVASKPYDVLSSKEARLEAAGNEKSLLHIIKPEIDLPEDTDVHSSLIYQKAVDNFNNFKQKGWLVQDDEAVFYIYAQSMLGKTQYGIVGCASIDDYFSDIIKKHELTRTEKEEDRIQHVYYTNANLEPVFFSYHAVPAIDELVKQIIQATPEYDFIADDQIQHQLWIVKDTSINQKIEMLFRDKVPCTYIADGHHRTAAGAKVGLRKRAENPNHTGNEEYNYFLAVHFPDNQLSIIDYNRVVKDLNGLTQEEFLKKLSEYFNIHKVGSEAYKPSRLHEFGMYMDKTWYQLIAKSNTYNDDDPIATLDVTISSEYILNKILDIKDLRTSHRVDFVGGIRGLGELERRVDSGEMIMALSLYPVSMKQLIDIADTGNIMPPKTTWFEPKLRSGLVIHNFE